jgi:hypothetical protein
MFCFQIRNKWNFVEYVPGMTHISANAGWIREENNGEPIF